MTNVIMSRLLGTASAAAIAMVVAAPANAFEQVNWTWDAALTETIVKDVNITIDLTPTGMVMVEDLQVLIGDVNASSEVNGIQNNQPDEGGTVDLGNLDVQFQYGLGGPGEGVVVLDNEFKSPEVTAATVDEGDEFPDINGSVTVSLDLGETEIAPTSSYDGLTELPSTLSSATAVGNSSSIVSDAATQLHEGQFLFNTGSGSAPVIEEGGEGGNSNLAMTALLTDLALNDSIGSSSITATSTVYDITNASVDSAATAVGNNLSVSVAPTSGVDNLLIADVTQFAFADITATSHVHDVSLNNYTSLGLLDGPIVSSVATAVGNNKSISVMTPVVAPVLQ